MNKFLLNCHTCLFVLLPITLVTGPFLSDLNLILFNIIFLINIFVFKRTDLFKNTIFRVFIIWYLYILVLSFLSDDIYLSLQSSLFYFRFILFFLGVYFILQISNKNLLYFFLSFLVVFLFVIIDAFFQFFFQFDFFGYEYTRYRLSGLFGDEKILGSYLSRLLPLILGLIFFNKEHINRFINYEIVFNILLFLSGILIYLSGERTAFFYFFIIIIFTILLKHNLKFYKYFFSFAFISIILFFSFFYSFNKERIIDETTNQIFKMNTQQFVNSEGEPYNITIPYAIFSIQHQALYITSIEIIKDNILFGIGPKLFRETCKKEKYQTFHPYDGSINGCQTHPHNTYIQIFTETGIIGFTFLTCIFIFIFFFLLKNIYGTWKKSYTNNQILEIYLLIGIFITLWPLVPSGNVFNNWLNIIYYIPLGFLLNSRYRLSNHTDKNL